MKKNQKVEVQFEQEVNIQAIDVKSMVIKIEGTTPFISHRFSERQMNQIENKQRKKTKELRERISVEQEVGECIHRLENGKVGYPSSAFYGGMRECAPYLTSMDKKLASGAVKMYSVDGNPLVEIKYNKQVTQKDFVKLSTGVADIRYRPRFEGWSCELLVSFNAAQISPQQIITLINLAGFHRGIGDNRPGSPKKPGSMGMYKVVENKK